MTLNIIHPAFVRVNNPKIYHELEKLGYKLSNSGDTTLDGHNYDGHGNHKHISEGTAIITSSGGYYGVVYDIDDVVKDGRIDCENNCSLFLAIAALNTDNNWMQWFTNGKHWFCSLYAPLDIHEWLSREYYKATVEELVEYFKVKTDE